MQISQFLRRFDGGLTHYCPACNEMHSFWLQVPNRNGCRWQWDGNIICPTFSPSMNISWTDPETKKVEDVCHYFLQKGQIKFLNDCTHRLKGLTIPLPAIPDMYRERGFM